MVTRMVYKYSPFAPYGVDCGVSQFVAGMCNQDTNIVSGCTDIHLQVSGYLWILCKFVCLFVVQ